MSGNIPIITLACRKRERDDPAAACLSGQAPRFKSLNHNGNYVQSGSRFGTGKETNEHRIDVRLKQIQYGKNTIGYDNYVAAVPKEKRLKYSMIHPRTPDPYEEASKRQFDGRLKAWRRQIHLWDCLEDIAQVEIQVQQTGSSSGDAMEGVVESRRPLIAMAPICTPNSKVISKPLIPNSTVSISRHRGPAAEPTPEPGECRADSLFKGNITCSSSTGAAVASSHYNGYSVSQDEEEALPYSKRFRTDPAGATGEEARGPDGCIGEDEGALDGVDYDCAGGNDDDDDVL